MGKNNLFDVKNKIAVVTGGLGTLGTEYAKTFLDYGAKVAVIDKVAPKKNHNLNSYLQTGNIFFITTDITKKNEVKSALDLIKKKWGVPEILINNAAIDFPPQKSGEKFETYSSRIWQEVLDVNVTGVFFCCQIFGGAMAKTKKGSIINISSTYGVLSPNQNIYTNFIKPASYGVSKSGVLNLTKYLATYWAKDGVRVNSLSLGGVFNDQPKDFVKKYSKLTPLGRMARKEEYNGAILFLASEASSYMTGSNLIIDGGWTAW